MESLLATWSPIAIISFALSPIIIAAIALGFSIWAGREQRKHNRLSVKPALGYEFDVTGLRLDNSGLGPARICSAMASVGEQDFDLSSEEDTAALADALFLNPIPNTVGTIGVGTYLMQGTHFNLIVTHESLVSRPEVAMKSRFEYQSMYDERMVPFTSLLWRPEWAAKILQEQKEQ